MSVPRNGLFHDPWTEINESVKTFTLHHLINMQQTANPLHTRYTACLTPAGETWLLTTQKTLSKARRLLSPLCCLLNSPHRSSRSLFPLPSSHALFIPVFRGFLPSRAWSIKHTCVLAPSPLHPLVLFPKPNREPMLSWWKSIDGWPFQTGRKLLQFRPSLVCVSCVSNLVSVRKSLYLSLA